MKKIFIVDIDGVAANHAKSICDCVNQEFDINSNPEDVRIWDYDFGPIKFIDAVRKYYSIEEFILNMEVTAGFNEFLQKISAGLSIQFATARKKIAHSPTIEWIKRNFGDHFDVKFVECKAEIEGDYVIDDSEIEIEKSVKNGKKGFLLRQPWNDSESVKKKISNIENAYYINCFDDICEIL